MILESLVRYYEALAERGELSKPGWSQVDVSYALDIDIDGHLKRVISLKKQSGKKLVPRKMTVPMQNKRSSDITPHYLCDNSTFILGIDTKDNPERSRDCFLAAKELHDEKMPAEEGAAIAVRRFFETWDVEGAETCEVIQEYKKDILKGGNLVFIYDGKFVHEYETVKEQWDKFYRDDDTNVKYRCGITGKMDALAVLHPAIKKIRGTHAAGGSLVSFNASAFSSYGKEQGANAQTGAYAAFAYGEALNYLTEKLTYKNYIGNTALIFYAINGAPEYQDVFSALFLGDDVSYSEEDLKKLVEDICEGHVAEFNEKQLDPNMEFYLLGLAPNKARLSVRFFERGRFGEFVKNIKEHQERLEIKSNKGEGKIIATWQLLQETCRAGTEASPVLAGELTRSIIENVRYPTTLINAVDLRIRADHNVGKRRAAIIKAYYLKNENKEIPKEVLTVGLNKETDNVPYNLGRLFAVLERIQEAASPGVNASIKDKYFGGASSTPAIIIPKLIDLAQSHLRKLNVGMKVYYNKQMGEIMEKFEAGYPKTLSLPERGMFQLGYYHQMQEFFSSKKGEE